MFDSISSMFSLPAISRNNKYKTQPSMQTFLKNKKKQSQKFVPLKDVHFDNFAQSLSTPLEQWILNQEPYLKGYAYNRKVFDLVIQNAEKRKLSKEQSSKITIHNLFVLMVQYNVLGQSLKHMDIELLELFIDGLCGIFLRQPQDESLEELTCTLHHILTKRQVYREKQTYRFKEKRQQIVTDRAFEVDNISNFIKIYGDLAKTLGKPVYDYCVRVIPMLAELFKLILHTNPEGHRHHILSQIKWLPQIGVKLLQLICNNIQEIAITAQKSQQLDDIPIEDEPNPELKKKLIEQAKRAKAMFGGFVSTKQLFIYACRELYFFQHVLRLIKFITVFAKDVWELYYLQQQRTMKFMTMLLKMTLKYDVSLLENQFECIKKIIQHIQFNTKEEVQRLSPLFGSPAFRKTIQSIQSCQLYQWQIKDHVIQMPLDRPQFHLQRQESFLNYVLRLVFNLQISFIFVIKTILLHTNKNLLPELQYYLIKNGFLHFMIEYQVSIQGEDRKSYQDYFQTLGYLVKNNSFAHCVLDQVLEQGLIKTKKCLLGEEIKKHFFQAKTYLLILLSDAIVTNFKNKDMSADYFLPLSARLLLYPEKSKPKHDIWISYIHDVLVRGLQKEQQKVTLLGRVDNSLDHQLFQWVSLAILIQIEHVLSCPKQNQELELAQFIMNYMTTILNEAIKWKHQDQTAAMKRIMNNHLKWEFHYSDVLYNTQNNEDVIQQKYGNSVVNFLFMKRWNRKIANSIKMFIDTVLTTNITKQIL